MKRRTYKIHADWAQPFDVAVSDKHAYIKPYDGNFVGRSIALTPEQAVDLGNQLIEWGKSKNNPPQWSISGDQLV